MMPRRAQRSLQQGEQRGLFIHLGRQVRLGGTRCYCVVDDEDVSLVATALTTNQGPSTTCRFCLCHHLVRQR
jgi:hypothetical protein